MKINLSALNNLTTLEFNTTAISDPTLMVDTLVTTSNEVSRGYLGLGIMVCVFIVLVFALFRNDGDIRLDIARSLQYSSGFTSIIGVVMLSTPLISSFIHVMWFLTIFVVMTVVVYNLKRKNL